jgi:diguanylate cyclase (GGDEF)-like protein
MLDWLLLILLVASHFGLCMAALAMRDRLGLAPLMIVVGALEGIKVYVLTGSLLELPGIGAVRLGSVVSYMNALAVVQVLYLRCGLAAARQLAWATVCVAVAMGLLNQLMALLLSRPGMLQPLPVNPQALASSARIEIVGDLLLLIGLVGGVLLVNALLRAGLGRWLSLFLTLAIVATLDNLLFIGLAFGPEALGNWSVLGPALAGKALMAMLLASLGSAYLGLSGGIGGSDTRLDGRELLAGLSFRRRLAELEQQLQTDPLTGIFNRRYLDQTVPELLHMDQLRGLPTSLLLLDLDHFKRINDSHGHLVGDQTLQHVALRLRASLRRNDVVLRFGGEEFVILLPCTPADEARRVGEQVLADLQAHPLQRQDGEPLSINATLGLATSPADGDDLRGLLQTADRRLYEGKRAGRGRLVAAG